MMRRWKLPESHAMLEISSSEGTCALLGRAYPNGGNGGGLLELPAVPEASLSESTCSPMLCLTPLCTKMMETREPFFYPLAVLIKIWGMGLRPMATHGP